MDEVCCRPFSFTKSLLFVDYYSKFIAVENLQNPHPETVFNKCKKVFSQFGIPKELIMGNGPKFSSHKFCSFSKTRDIPHKMISRHYHQSNGLAEGSIQTELSTKQNLILKIISLQCYP